MMKRVIFIWVLFSAFMLAPKVLAYEPYPTHYFLAQKSAEIFERALGEKISMEELGWLGEGAKMSDVNVPSMTKNERGRGEFHRF